MQAARIGRHGFGWIIVNGKRWDRDILITADQQVVRRPKHLSEKYGGWHTVLGPEEIEGALDGNPDIVLIGRGHLGILPIRKETRELLARRGIRLQVTRLAQALASYPRYTSMGWRVAAVLHITC